ncbi:S-layer homology domain-containing protein [Paenibacillus eucommiae]|uniref:Chitodextrinase n=1 Tax=Paenibacillus eucommiae TaxID=1355755 RepID=A0ABS4IWW4_9BACL|nr:S-layer homology domain-containing protein [Paenibacillus eucommiae]MBP1992079.1 chitodextrinase [Paenibacillus eucommiae]
MKKLKESKELKGLKRKFKKMVLRAFVVTLAVSFTFQTVVNAAVTDEFMIGAFLAPPTPHVSEAQYNYLKDAEVTHVINIVDSGLNSDEDNKTMLEYAAKAGVKAIATGAGVNFINSYSDREIDSIIDRYKDYSALGGIYVRDEPPAIRFDSYARIYNRSLHTLPDSVPYANMLPLFADPFTMMNVAPKEEVSQTTVGGWRNTNSSLSLGQSFTTLPDSHFIYGIELNVDVTKWQNNNLTLTLWDSPDKTKQLASSTLSNSNNMHFPRFELMTSVTPNTAYYFELTHGGNTVPVAVSTEEVYTGGSAFENGTTQLYDVYFKVYGGRTEIASAPVFQQFSMESHPLTSTSSFGQAFLTSHDLNYIESIELSLDYNTWGTNEFLTLSLWDSPAKQTLIASDTRNSTTNVSKVNFSIDAQVSPNQMYYWELTHAGGGDNSVTIQSAPSEGYYSPQAKLPFVTTAYVNGVAQTFDFFFNVYKKSVAKRPLLTSQTMQGAEFTVTSSNPIGQTFQTPATGESIESIATVLDIETWGAGESLTLQLWDSPAKTSLLGSASLTESNGYSAPVFNVNAPAQPNTAYYLELSHNGGGDNSIVVMGSGSDVYANGAIFENGVMNPDQDVVFKVYGNADPVDKTVEQIAKDTGEYVSDERLGVQKLGQTFKTPQHLNRILQFIELNMETAGWTADEALTVTIYDSVNKNEMLGSASLKGTNNGDYPRFYVNAILKPDTSYYFELTHTSGGDGQVGRVWRTAGESYTDGNAHWNGIKLEGDFYFRAAFTSLYQDFLEEWVDAVGPTSLKYLSFDIYPFMSGKIKEDYYLNLDLIRDMGMQKDVKTHSFLQSVGIEGWMDRPNENQMRWNVFTNLAYGIQALSWFTWSTPLEGHGPFTSSIIDRAGEKSDLYEPVKNLNAQVTSWGPVFMQLESEGVYHSGATPVQGTRKVPKNFFWQPANASDDVIVSHFKHSSGKDYIMVVNKSITDSQTFSFQLNPKPVNVNELSKTSGKEISTNYNEATGEISATFLPGEGRLYVISDGNEADQSLINPAEWPFDKYASGDVQVSMELKGNTLTGVWNTGKRLKRGSEYLVAEDGNSVTIKKEYLTSLQLGDNSLDFVFNAGADQSLEITITDSTPLISAPAWIGGGLLTSSSTTTTSIALHWSGAADSNEITGYKVYKNGSEIAAVSGNVYDFAVTGLSPATEYSFKVEAGNESGLWSVDGPSVKVTTQSESAQPGNPNPNPNPNPPANSGVNGQEKDDSKDSRIKVVSDKDLQKAQNGIVTISLEEGQDELSLPLNAADFIGQHVFEVISGGMKVQIPVSTLKEAGALTTTQASGQRIFVRLGKTDEVSHDGSKSRLTMGGQAYVLGLSVRTASQVKELNTFNHSIELTLPYDVKKVDADLVAIYYYNKLTVVWEYVGGSIDKEHGKVQASVGKPGIYAVLEYDKTFADVPETHWVHRTLKVLTAQQIVQGVNDEEFQPDKKTTRAAFVSLLVKALGLQKDTPSTPFTDVRAGDWYAEDVAAAYAAGLIQGLSETKFAPNAEITREQMAALLVRAYEYRSGSSIQAGNELSQYKDGALVSEWMREHVNKAISVGLMQGRGAEIFDPRSDTTRAEAAKAIFNFIHTT